MQLRRTRNRNHPGLLSKQPSQRDLCTGHFFPVCHLTQNVYQLLIRLARLLMKAWNYIAEVFTVECCVLVDGSSEEAFAERAERHQADTQFFECRNDLLLRLPPPEGVLAL